MYIYIKEEQKCVQWPRGIGEPFCYGNVDPGSMSPSYYTEADDLNVWESCTFLLGTSHTSNFFWGYPSLDSPLGAIYSANHKVFGIQGLPSLKKAKIALGLPRGPCAQSQRSACRWISSARAPSARGENLTLRRAEKNGFRACRHAECCRVRLPKAQDKES